MLALPSAVLVHLDALTVIELVLHRDVIAPLALLTRQRHLHALFVLRHDSLLENPFWVLRYFWGPEAPPGSGGGSRTRDTTIMSRVL